MNWGTKIAISFIVFMGIIITMVVVSMRQEVSLVANDYYRQEIAYQDQIDKIENQNELTIKPELIHDQASTILKLSMPGDKQIIGDIHFYRPSDASLDKKFTIEMDEEGNQYFSTNDFKKGLWRVKVTWQDKAKSYYYEQNIVI